MVYLKKVWLARGTALFPPRFGDSAAGNRMNRLCGNRALAGFLRVGPLLFRAPALTVSFRNNLVEHHIPLKPFKRPE
jgi:hypothetical protein